ncbi:hypothetical protein DVA67_013535 [Solirubrobacter sp. CPCC 204708]|uniref:Uncharacterized protein n=1 Tax=Solirubrobacter deserti TaxID=2282478 RepID=A0ABT4RC55_9ACTN|nr:hypothetical protein [Solirubrobacter deserti]MBE2316999.1 hypothetical protein [Solirubrobacter deserti]MDA0136109.1 hypothetical protein [Solirubrobacter deserti]
MLRLLSLFILGSLVMAAPAHGAASRCPKGTDAIGPKHKPRACVPRSLPAESPTALKGLVKGKPNRRLEALAMRMLGARAAQAGPELPPGVKLIESDGAVELRNQAGDGVTMGSKRANQAPGCPKANGDVPAKYDETMTFGFADAKQGKRTWTLITMRYEGPWSGHVGVDAKAHTFDLTPLRGEISIKSGVEIAATGKVLKRNPTRTYRTALTRSAIPVGVDPVSLLREFTVRGPKGSRGDDTDREVAGKLLGFAVWALSDIKTALKEGDVRWHDQYACAQRDYTASPEKVVKGGRADWSVRALAEDGTPVTDARWGMSSGCGAISAESASGPTVQVGVVDQAGEWIHGTPGACAVIGATTPAGRIPPIFSTIPPVEPKRYRYDIKIDYRKSMGPGIAETLATGTGTFTTGPGEGSTPGTGTFSGSEWDGTAVNSCGKDMLRTRTFTSIVAVGGEIQGDQVVIGFTAVERAFDAAWIETFPVTGGERTIESRAPFCGTPNLALRTAKISVKATPVSG